MDAVMIGHAGDGNIHVDFPYREVGSADYETIVECNRLIVQKALELEGTATGEHGVGIGKKQFMAHEHGAALDVMKSIKQALGPQWHPESGQDFLNGEVVLVKVFVFILVVIKENHSSP